MSKGVKNSTKGTHITYTLSSHTLNPKIAFGYSGIGCCIMRVKLSKGCKAILIDNISGYDEDEILLPFNTKYYIDFARHSINYYKNNIICPDETQAKKVIVTDLSIIPPRHLSKQKLQKSSSSKSSLQKSSSPKLSSPKSSPKTLSKYIYNFSLSKLWNK
jgi:hypothetical protein